MTKKIKNIKQIVQAPHPALRQQAQSITDLTPDVQVYLDNLEVNLINQKKPAAAGLALPQLNIQYRAFATFLETAHSRRPQVRIFINPKITDQSDKKVVGPSAKHPDLEGCLSIPKLYGPVYRPEWATFEYQILENGQLSDLKKETFFDFSGRVMQHELDHLDGVLFTDYTLRDNLPLYTTNQYDELVSVDPIVAEAF